MNQELREFKKIAKGVNRKWNFPSMFEENDQELKKFKTFRKDDDKTKDESKNVEKKYNLSLLPVEKVEKRTPKCILCKNHGNYVAVKNHKRWCPKRMCVCPKCSDARVKRKLSAAEIKRQRATKEEKDREEKKKKNIINSDEREHPWPQLDDNDKHQIMRRNYENLKALWNNTAIEIYYSPSCPVLLPIINLLFGSLIQDLINWNDEKLKKIKTCIDQAICTADAMMFRTWYVNQDKVQQEQVQESKPAYRDLPPSKYEESIYLKPATQNRSKIWSIQSLIAETQPSYSEIDSNISPHPANISVPFRPDNASASPYPENASGSSCSENSNASYLS